MLSVLSTRVHVLQGAFLHIFEGIWTDFLKKEKKKKLKLQFN